MPPITRFSEERSLISQLPRDGRGNHDGATHRTDGLREPARDDRVGALRDAVHRYQHDVRRRGYCPEGEEGDARFVGHDWHRRADVRRERCLVYRVRDDTDEGEARADREVLPPRSDYSSRRGLERGDRGWCKGLWLAGAW